MGMSHNRRRAIIAVIGGDSVPNLASQERLQERLMRLAEASPAPIFIVGLNRGDGSAFPAPFLNELTPSI